MNKEARLAAIDAMQARIDAAANEAKAAGLSVAAVIKGLRYAIQDLQWQEDEEKFFEAEQKRKAERRDQDAVAEARKRSAPTLRAKGTTPTKNWLRIV